ncbi:hypothetical protein [Kitasatospora sp. Root187]|uniref:hypothetical protein n=1 Tax=Kitasatospora sp. Root187 TaxID=1736486 RepID=UPI0012FA9DFB|nr:hypothetical protein [Kitasatospora sp. Root187]
MAVSILVATAVLAAVAGLARAAATAGVRERLAVDAARSVEVDARWTAQGLPAADRAVHAALVRAMGGAPFRTETAMRAVGALDLPLPPAGRRQVTDRSTPCWTGSAGSSCRASSPGRWALRTACGWSWNATTSPSGPTTTVRRRAPRTDAQWRAVQPGKA